MFTIKCYYRGEEEEANLCDYTRWDVYCCNKYHIFYRDREALKILTICSDKPDTPHTEIKVHADHCGLVYIENDSGKTIDTLRAPTRHEEKLSSAGYKPPRCVVGGAEVDCEQFHNNRNKQ